MTTLVSRAAFLVSALALSATPAMAGDWYLSGSIGALNQSDSDNEGATGAFTTGNLGDGSTLAVADGTPYGWNTDFETGASYAIEVGKRTDKGLRFGAEGVFTNADVDTHTNVTLGGGSIDAVDAAAIAGSPDPLGVTVAQVVADGRGEISQQALFANVYYDFTSSSAITPYVGAGIGVSDVDVEYRPSDIGVIDDGQTKFAYQGKAGLTLSFDSPLEVFGEVAYRATSDVETRNDLFPGSLDIENKQFSFGAGVRFAFGG